MLETLLWYTQQYCDDKVAERLLFPSHNICRNSIITTMNEAQQKILHSSEASDQRTLQRVLQHVLFPSCWQQRCAAVLGTNFVSNGFRCQQTPPKFTCHFHPYNTPNIVAQPCCQQRWGQDFYAWKWGFRSTCILSSCSSLMRTVALVNLLLCFGTLPTLMLSLFPYTCICLSPWCIIFNIFG